MAKRKRNRKGQFTKGRSNKPRKRSRGRRSSTKRGGTRLTARKAYMRNAPRRRARRNKAIPSAVTNKILMNVILWSSAVAFGQGWVSSYLGKITNSPMVAQYGTLAITGWLGLWLTKKAKTRPAGYAVLGVALAKLAVYVGSATGLFTETGAGFLPRSSVMRRLPNRVSIPSLNPVGRIVVPG